MALGIFRMPNPSSRFAKWLEMLAECRSEIEQVQDDLYRSYFEIVHQLLSETTSVSADSVLEIIRNSVDLLDVLSPRDTADRQMHREVYIMTDHVVALTRVDVLGEWKKRGYMHNLREILRAVMFLQALYQGLRKLSFCNASKPLPPDTHWVIEVFRIDMR